MEHGSATGEWENKGHVVVLQMWNQMQVKNLLKKFRNYETAEQTFATQMDDDTYLIVYFPSYLFIRHIQGCAAKPSKAIYESRF